ncbi:MAG: cobalt-precorrin-5B (C(1))-methyltransferase, partial [Pseudomonadota bacterium]
IRKNPGPRVTIAGGFAKMTKLAQGLLDLHSRAGAVDHAWLADLAGAAGADPAVEDRIAQAVSAQEALLIAGQAGLDLAMPVARAAQGTALALMAGSGVAIDVAVFERDGQLLAATDPAVG